MRKYNPPGSGPKKPKSIDIFKKSKVVPLGLRGDTHPFIHIWFDDTGAIHAHNAHNVAASLMFGHLDKRPNLIVLQAGETRDVTVELSAYHQEKILQS